eukprot:gb/GEZN01009579.1/.p1 GENE.gb/GEZN01009579.1/~~gb/GEZN01009579.1/.p1  ORF type:complete len:295 (-),score=6.49 gb/GEZN01009579.1/:407-1291(-)
MGNALRASQVLPVDPNLLCTVRVEWEGGHCHGGLVHIFSNDGLIIKLAPGARQANQIIAGDNIKFHAEWYEDCNAGCGPNARSENIYLDAPGRGTLGFRVRMACSLCCNKLNLTQVQVPGGGGGRGGLDRPPEQENMREEKEIRGESARDGQRTLTLRLEKGGRCVDRKNIFIPLDLGITIIKCYVDRKTVISRGDPIMVNAVPFAAGFVSHRWEHKGVNSWVMPDIQAGVQIMGQGVNVGIRAPAQPHRNEVSEFTASNACVSVTFEGGCDKGPFRQASYWQGDVIVIYEREV